MNDDQLLDFYLSEGIEFDTVIWLKIENTYELTCYKNDVQISRPLVFFNQFSMNQFCIMGNCKRIIEAD